MYIKSEGTEFQLTAPYSPQQNGKAEGKNRTWSKLQNAC